VQRGLKGRHEALQRGHGHAGDIQERKRAGLQTSERSTSHRGGLLTSEASCTINRDKLNSFNFATERGQAGYEQYRCEFAQLIWQLASPQWAFDAATFERSATAFDNPDHVRIVIHNYRWRLGLADGEPQYDALEQRLAQGPVIAVPTITLEGDANGAPHPDARAYAKQFAGKYAHRVITGGIGHNLPQESPQAFADAVLDVDRF
jgi:pimeloyl-ACP methyl ester carboxylesterase